VHEGQPVDVKIIHINTQRRRLGLSVRQAGNNRVEVETYSEPEEATAEEGPDQTEPDIADASEEPQATFGGVTAAELMTATEPEASPQESTPAASEEESAEVPETNTVDAVPPVADEAPDTDTAIDMTSPEAPAEGNTPAGEQHSSAAEIEPVDSSPSENESVTVASTETSPVSHEESSADDGDERTEVASAARQGSGSE
jgi:hypothetical protein